MDYIEKGLILVLVAVGAGTLIAWMVKLVQRWTPEKDSEELADKLTNIVAEAILRHDKEKEAAIVGIAQQQVDPLAKQQESYLETYARWEKRNDEYCKQSLAALDSLNATMEKLATSQERFLRSLFGGSAFPGSSLDVEPDGVRKKVERLMSRHPDLTQEEALQRARAEQMYSSPMRENA